MDYIVENFILYVIIYLKNIQAVKYVREKWGDIIFWMFHVKDFFSLIIFQVLTICPYWLSGLISGNGLTLFGSDKIQKLAIKISDSKFTALKITSASVLGAASPITMHGMVPLIVIMGGRGVSEYILAAFIISSILINPNVFIYSLAISAPVALIRLLLCILAGIMGGYLVKLFFNKKKLFVFENYETDAHKSIIIRSTPHKFMLGMKGAVIKTGPNLLLGIILTALFDKFFPRDLFNSIFVSNKGLGVLFGASMGVPIYFCGGGTIPLISAWMKEGMSLGSAVAFMITGPATKLNNLSAVKNITGGRSFSLYLVYNLCFGVTAGLIIDLVLKLF